jgi:hypothetical protein
MSKAAYRNRLLNAAWKSGAASIAALLAGCASTMPVYPLMPARESLDAVARNMAMVQTMRSRCEVSFTDAGGDSVELEAAVVAAFPDRFHVQAWKFDRVVMDVTCVRGEVYTLPDSAESPTPGAVDLARQTPARIAHSLAPFTAGFWARAEPVEDRCTADRVVAASMLEGGDAVLCFVDRRTLTPVRFEPLRPTRERAGEFFELSGYRTIAGAPWPTAWRFESEHGRAEIRLHDVELNGAVEDDVFTPPRRAVKLP